jgi:hypothetical protein
LSEIQKITVVSEIDPEGLALTKKNALYPRRMNAVPGPRLSILTDPHFGAKDIVGPAGPIVDAAAAGAAVQVLIVRASSKMTVFLQLPKNPIADPVKIALAGA